MPTTATSANDDPLIEAPGQSYQPSVSPALSAFTRVVPYAVLAISIVPILVGYAWITLATFTNKTEGLKPIGGFTLRHWEFLRDPDIWRATLNSFIIAMSSVIMVTLLASLAAYALSRMAFRGRRGFMSVTLVLNAFRPEMLLIAIFQVLLFLGGLPIIGEYVGFNTVWGVALVLVTLELPLGIWLMKGFMDAVSWDVERSALIDGASRYRIWREIIIPQIRPGLAALAILMFIQGWNAYLIPQTFTVGTKVSTLSVFLNQFSADTGQQAWNEVAAIGMFQLIPILIFFLFTQKHLLNIYGGGVKGGS